MIPTHTSRRASRNGALRHAGPRAQTLASALEALHAGDFSVRLDPGRGIDPSTARAFNALAARNERLTGELTRLAAAVESKGDVGGRASLEGASGGWTTSVKAVNTLIENLVRPVIEVSAVIDAVAQGDLARTMPDEVDGRPLKGEFLRASRTVNRMVSQLKAFASEVTRVAREVGTEGKLGGQARVKGVAGTWKDLTENVNSMAANLTSQVRNIAEVTTAVARGDLSKKITVDVQGEILELKDTINTMVDQLNGFASEVTRVAREVGTEGKLGGQARVKGVAGTWKDLTHNVNSMAANLTSQVRNIADVMTAVARGDLSRKVTVEVRGEIRELKDTVNTLLDKLNGFASEVTRVAREVGTEGKLGGQAVVRDVAGVWKDLTDNVNTMADNLTSQVRNIAEVTTAVANGDLSRKITVDVRGEILELKDTINTMVDQLNGFASEVTRVAREVGTEGKLGGQARVKGVAGTWKDLTENVNSMAANLTSQVRNIAEVTTAVARGDLSKKITVDVRGEILELKDTINTMVDRLNAFASEVTRVARDVGTEGKLGGQAVVRDVAGVWKDLTDNVNTMADNLTSQVRGIARVVTAVANGDLEQNLTLEAKGEIAVLAETINEMIGTLAVFADQVSGVAREVGVEGRLGGQAQVPGASGTWRDLTDNVNRLAANLTTQVRAIAEVATAVTHGDLTRSIAVDARGEVAALKDNINEMIGNLKGTTEKNTQQDWLNSNLARFGRMLQGQRDLQAVSRLALSELAGLVSARCALLYVVRGGKDQPRLELSAAWADGGATEGGPSRVFRPGEGLVGQCALEGERILLTEVPSHYVRISSGLGEAAPTCLAVVPVIFEGQVKAVMELASFHRFSEIQLALLDQLMESLGIVLNTIETTMQTEELLRQSQLLTERLRAQQEQLQKTNEELEEKARLLTEQKAHVEVKNREVERASEAVEEKAAQLALASKYKSEFLANMSHELRTPLNSLLILAKLLADDPEGSLTAKQVEFAETIYSSGRDLLALINEILDLSKIESGTMGVDVGDVSLAELAAFAERGFGQVARDKGLSFEVVLASGLSPSIRTDARRLQQVVRNLLSNAFKFTDRGGVVLHLAPAREGWPAGHDVLSAAEDVVAFSVEDTGIGIPPDKQQIIFEAFQQADGTTSRRFGGTGLGLSISREIVRILGGSMRLVSEPGKGSTFTFFLPTVYAGSVGTTRRESTAAATGVRSHAPALPLPAPRVRMPEPAPADDDRASIRPGDRVILIVEEDPHRAAALRDVAHQAGFRAVVAARGEWAMSLARIYRPQGLVLSRLRMGADGGTAFDRLWHDEAILRLPVHIVGTGGTPTRGLRTYVRRPVQGPDLREALARCALASGRRPTTLLVVTTDPTLASEIAKVGAEEGVRLSRAAGFDEAVASWKVSPPDAILVDQAMDASGAEEVMESLRRDPALRTIPVVLCATGGLSEEEAGRLRDAVAGLPDPDRRSAERLLEDAAFFLQRVAAADGRAAGRCVSPAEAGATLAGRRVFVVDDDARNVFAITSVLEQQGMRVRHATSAQEALASLERDPDVEVVLMDIMMPNMDGYEAIRRLRAMARFSTLPIVALTAKAMQGDRERCLEAGASDYISKPVETDQLLSLLRAWVAP